MNSKAHLIPIKKAVFDRRKGFILRTYYVRPEYIERIIRKYKGLEPEPVIKNFKPLPKIIDSIKLGNPSLLKDIITHNNKKYLSEWNIIEIRNLNLSNIKEENPHYYNSIHSIQSSLSFILSNDKTFISKLRKSINNSKIKYVFTKTITIQREWTPNIFNNTKYKRRYYYGKNINFKSLTYILEKTINSQSSYINSILNNNIYNRKKNIEYKLNIIKPKFGYIRYKYKLGKEKDNITIGNMISRMINLTLTHPIKVLNIINKMNSSTKELNEILLNIDISPLIDFKNVNIKENDLVKTYPYIVFDTLYNFQKLYNQLSDLYDYNTNSIIYKYAYLRYIYEDLYDKLPDIINIKFRITELDELKDKSLNTIYNYINCNDNDYIYKLILFMYVLEPKDIYEIIKYILSKDYGLDIHKYLYIIEGVLNRKDIRTSEIYTFIQNHINNIDDNITNYANNYTLHILKVLNHIYNHLNEDNVLRAEEIIYEQYIDFVIELYNKALRLSYISGATDSKRLMNIKGFNTITTTISKITGSKEVFNNIKDNVYNYINKNIITNEDIIYIPILSDRKYDYQYIRYLYPIEVGYDKGFIDTLIDKYGKEFLKDYMDFIPIDKGKVKVIKKIPSPVSDGNIYIILFV